MHLYLTRRVKGPRSTIGTIEHDGQHIAYTCEDVIREPEAGHPATSDAGALAAPIFLSRAAELYPELA